MWGCGRASVHVERRTPRLIVWKVARLFDYGLPEKRFSAFRDCSFTHRRPPLPLGLCPARPRRTLHQGSGTHRTFDRSVRRTPRRSEYSFVGLLFPETTEADFLLRVDEVNRSHRQLCEAVCPANRTTQRARVAHVHPAPALAGRKNVPALATTTDHFFSDSTARESDDAGSSRSTEHRVTRDRTPDSFDDGTAGRRRATRRHFDRSKEPRQPSDRSRNQAARRFFDEST